MADTDRETWRTTRVREENRRRGRRAWRENGELWEKTRRGRGVQTRWTVIFFFFERDAANFDQCPIPWYDVYGRLFGLSLLEDWF